MPEGFRPKVEIIRKPKPDINLDGDIVTFLIQKNDIQYDGNQAVIKIQLDELKAAIGVA